SIEEQFYLMWPICFWAIAHWRSRLLLPVTAFVAVLSLAALVAAFGNHREATFYLIPFRIWELAFGAWLALLPAPEPVRASRVEILAGSGLTLIIATAVFVDEAHSLSGLAAIPACLGSALLIRSGMQPNQP